MKLSGSDVEDLHGYYSKLGYLEQSWAGATFERAWLYSEQVHPEGEITAYPTGKHTPDPRSQPRTDDWELMGRVSARLQVLSPLHKRVLALFHGDKGALCAARNHRLGRHVALFELTPAGRAIVRRERKAQGRSRLRVSGAELIQNAVGRAELRTEDKPDIALALLQAQRLRERAEAAYSAASLAMARERYARRAPPPFVRAIDDGEL